MDPTAMPPPTHRNGGWPSSGGGGAFHTPHPQSYQQHQQQQRAGLPYPTPGYAADPSSMSVGGGGGGGSSMLYNPPSGAAGSSMDPTWGADVTRAHHHLQHQQLHHHHHYAHPSQATNNMIGTPGPGDAPWWDGRRHEGLKADNAPSNRQQWPEGPSSTRLHAQHDREGGGQLQPGREEQQNQQQQQQQLEHQVYELHQGLLKYRAALQDERRRREAAEARVKELEQRIHLLLATSVAEQQAQLLRGATAASHPAPAMTPRNGITGYGGAGVVNGSGAGFLSVPSVGAVGVTDTPSLLHNVNAAAWAPQQQQQSQQHQAQLQLMARLDILESQNELLRQRLYENGGQGNGNGGGGTMPTTQKGGGAAGGGGAQS